MIDIDYQTFVTQATTQQGLLFALPTAKEGCAQANEALEAARVISRDREARLSDINYRLKEQSGQGERNPFTEEEAQRLRVDAAVAAKAVEDAERAMSVANQRVCDLETGQTVPIQISPAVVADHQAALTAAGAKVDHLREVLAALDTRLDAHAAHAAALEVQQRQAARDREDARAASLLGEAGPVNVAVDDAPPPAALNQGIQDDQEARAGIARRLAEALAEQERVQALIPLLRQTVVAQEYAAIAAKHTAAADKELALRIRANALAPLVVRWTGRQMSNRAPRPESYYISDQYRDEELARLQSVWPPLF